MYILLLNTNRDQEGEVASVECQQYGDHFTDIFTFNLHRTLKGSAVISPCAP